MGPRQGAARSTAFQDARHVLCANIEVHGGVLESIVVCPWFLDNADDFREIDGLLQKGQGFLIDEITLKKVHV